MKVPFGLDDIEFTLLCLVALIVVAVALETFFQTIGKIFTAKHDAAKADADARKAASELEHSKLEEGMLPVQICSSAGHACGAPYHDVREDGDGKGNKRRGPNDQGVGSRL